MPEVQFKGRRSPRKNAKSKARNAVRRADRRKAAEARQAATAKLTPKQRLDKLDRILGVSQGAKREREKLSDKCAAGT